MIHRGTQRDVRALKAIRRLFPAALGGIWLLSIVRRAVVDNFRYEPRTTYGRDLTPDADRGQAVVEFSRTSSS